MTSGTPLVFFLLLVELGVLSMVIMKECGENIEFTPHCNDLNVCNPNSTIINVVMYKGIIKRLKQNIKTLTDTDPHCSEKFCVDFRKVRKELSVTVHSVTFEEHGPYSLEITDTNGITERFTFQINVTGLCEPKLSSSMDKLTCEADVENIYEPTIVWMDRDRKYYQTKTFQKNTTKNFQNLNDALKLTDETRKVEMCCNISYKNKDGERKEKVNCRHLPLHVGSEIKNDTDNTKIIIPILCVLGLAICAALYILYRRRASSIRKSRERTFSEVGLMEDHQAGDTSGTPSEPLQGPQNQV